MAAYQARPKGRASMYPGKGTITERIVKAGSLEWERAWIPCGVNGRPGYRHSVEESQHKEYNQHSQGRNPGKRPQL